MFVRILRNTVVDRAESVDELRQKFPNISFPSEVSPEVKLPSGWYIEDEVKETLGE